MSDEDLLRRLRRLEQQVRAFSDLHVSEVSELARKLAAISQLQADELALILGELEGITKDVGATAAADVTPSAAPAPPPPVPDASVPSADPAAASPKRAKWLAEQERHGHVSRRELLLGRDDERPPG